ncbi:TPA: hypothetical protein ACGPI4_005538, partial [Bacillus paranthracis]
KKNAWCFSRLPAREVEEMLKFRLKKSEDNLEMDLSINFEKIISLVLGTSTLVEVILNSL